MEDRSSLLIKPKEPGAPILGSFLKEKKSVIPEYRIAGSYW